MICCSCLVFLFLGPCLDILRSQLKILLGIFVSSTSFGFPQASESLRLIERRLEALEKLGDLHVTLQRPPRDFATSRLRELVERLSSKVFL